MVRSSVELASARSCSRGDIVCDFVAMRCTAVSETDLLLCESGVAVRDEAGSVCDRCKSANLKAGSLLGVWSSRWA